MELKELKKEEMKLVNQVNELQSIIDDYLLELEKLDDKISKIEKTDYLSEIDEDDFKAKFEKRLRNNGISNIKEMMNYFDFEIIFKKIKKK